MSSHAPFILASASPRRRLLLAQIGLECEVRVADLDEGTRTNEAPSEYVLRLALAKAGAVAKTRGTKDRRPILAADTAVVVDREILGKPANREDCRRQLGLLSGREHEVLTGVALVANDKPTTRLSVSHVNFRPLEAVEVDAYWATGEPADKAGSYGIQGLGAVFIREIRGSYSGIMGLPLFETAELLRSAGIKPNIMRKEAV